MKTEAQMTCMSVVSGRWGQTVARDWLRVGQSLLQDDIENILSFRGSI